MRLIDADELVRDIDELSKDAGFYRPIYEGVKNGINVQQIIDAVPVVRCKDCKNWTVDGAGKPWCHGWSTYQSEGDSFCSYGERKEADGNG